MANQQNDIDLDDVDDEETTELDRSETDTETDLNTLAEVDPEAAQDTVEGSTVTNAASAPAVEIVRGEREFHIGGTVVKENDSTAGLSNEQARDVLKTMFPEIANATFRERSDGGVSVVEFLPQPGRKG